MAIPRNLANIAPHVAGSSGGITGLTFNATQSASAGANTLDDYEEGTWTPTATGASSAGTTTYAAQAGFYTKIGRLVTVQISLSYSAMTGTGDMVIGGLPFTSGGGASQYSVGSTMTSGLNWTTGTMLTSFIGSGFTTFKIFGSSDNGAGGYQQCVNETAEIYITMTYAA